MCIIAVKKAGMPLFPEETIRTMFKKNADGAGVMWAEDGRVHIRKGFMKVPELLEFLNSRDWTDVPLVLHCRIGTSGLMDEKNCHPYPIRKQNSVDCECDLAVAHNGILQGYTPSHKSAKNDTQMFISKVLNKLPKRFLKNEAICELLDEALGYNKLVFLDKDGNIYLRGGNKGASFINDDGYIYTNTSYKESTWNSSYKGCAYYPTKLF